MRAYPYKRSDIFNLSIWLLSFSSFFSFLYMYICIYTHIHIYRNDKNNERSFAYLIHIIERGRDQLKVYIYIFASFALYIYLHIKFFTSFFFFLFSRITFVRLRCRFLLEARSKEEASRVSFFFFSFFFLSFCLSSCYPLINLSFNKVKRNIIPRADHQGTRGEDRRVILKRTRRHLSIGTWLSKIIEI